LTFVSVECVTEAEAQTRAIVYKVLASSRRYLDYHQSIKSKINQQVYQYFSGSKQTLQHNINNGNYKTHHTPQRRHPRASDWQTKDRHYHHNNYADDPQTRTTRSCNHGNWRASSPQAPCHYGRQGIRRYDEAKG
jgi:hypothetical protein